MGTKRRFHSPHDPISARLFYQHLLSLLVSLELYDCCRGHSTSPVPCPVLSGHSLPHSGSCSHSRAPEDAQACSHPPWVSGASSLFAKMLPQQEMRKSSGPKASKSEKKGTNREDGLTSHRHSDQPGDGSGRIAHQVTHVAPPTTQPSCSGAAWGGGTLPSGMGQRGAGDPSGRFSIRKSHQGRAMVVLPKPEMGLLLPHTTRTHNNRSALAPTLPQPAAHALADQWPIPQYTAELSGCDREHMPTMPKIFVSGPLRKGFQSSALEGQEGVTQSEPRKACDQDCEYRLSDHRYRGSTRGYTPA